MQHGVEHRDVDTASTACAFPIEKRRQHTLAAEYAAAQVGKGNSQARGWTTRLAGSRHMAGDCLDANVQRWIILEWASRAKPCDGALNDTRINSTQRLVINLQAIENSRPEVIDDHIGHLYQVLEQLATCIGLEVNHDALFVSVKRQKKPA